MLLPALSRARERGRQAVCASNERQWYMILQMYGEDFREELPPHNPVLAYLQVMGDMFSEYIIPAYNIDRRFWFCPSDRWVAGGAFGDPDYWWNPANHVFGRSSSYMFLLGRNTNRNACYTAGGRDVPDWRRARPEEVMFGDMYRYGNIVGFNNNHILDQPLGNNMLTVDGAVTWQPATACTLRYATTWLGQNFEWYW